jgi:hypothetical protein
MNKMVRKQLFITAEQNRRLKLSAAATGVAEAELIREGIDLRLEHKAEDADWRNAFDNLSGSWAARENLHEEMLEIRRRWNRRDQILNRKGK